MTPFPLFSKVAIVGLAVDQAPLKIKSSFLEKQMSHLLAQLKLPLGLIESLTGIKERRFYPLDYMPSQAAAEAANNLFTKINFNPQKINLLYSTSVCRDYVEPSTASIVQAKLKLGPYTKNLDIGSACLGFIDGMELAALQIEMGLAQYALIVAGENSAPVNYNTIKRLKTQETNREDFFKNFATLTLGSGAAAMLLGPREKHPHAPYLKGMLSLSDTESNHLCYGNQDEMFTDSTQLLIKGIALAKKTFNAGLKRFNWLKDDFKHFIAHQVSAANTKKMCEALELNEDKLFKTFPQYGNMGPCAIPYTLHLAKKENLLKNGDSILLMGIGSGLCCSMLEIIWQELT